MKKLAFTLTAASGAAAFLASHDAEASTQHTVQSGESLWSIAQQHNTSVDAIKKNNNLTDNMVFPGQVLTIGGSSNSSSSSSSSNQSSKSTQGTSQSSGSTHTVKSGESLNMIANQYGVSVDALMRANNLNGYLIHPDQTLTIPNGSTTSGGGSGSSATQNNTSHSTNSPVFNHQNLYDWGQCTWHVFNRRAETGQGISTYWWNADHWASNAAADGYLVDNRPEAGAILQTYAGAVGHVAYVEQVNPDGSLLISEMNYNTPPGVVDYRTIPASEVSSYNYIH